VFTERTTNRWISFQEMKSLWFLAQDQIDPIRPNLSQINTDLKHLITREYKVIHIISTTKHCTRLIWSCGS
jgi:hypothetical protein